MGYVVQATGGRTLHAEFTDALDAYHRESDAALYREDGVLLAARGSAQARLPRRDATRVQSIGPAPARRMMVQVRALRRALVRRYVARTRHQRCGDRRVHAYDEGTKRAQCCRCGRWRTLFAPPEAVGA